MSAYSSKVTEAIPSLTHSQRTVASCVLEHPDVTAFATLDDVAMKIGVSTTTTAAVAMENGRLAIETLRQTEEFLGRGNYLGL